MRSRLWDSRVWAARSIRLPKDIASQGWRIGFKGRTGTMSDAIGFAEPLVSANRARPAPAQPVSQGEIPGGDLYESASVKRIKAGQC